MKISHLQLEACRANPRQWTAARLGRSGDGFRTFGYNQAVKFAIYKFHGGSSAGEAKDYLADKLKRFSNVSRIHYCEATLDAYLDWAGTNSIIVADCKIRLDLSLGHDVALGGEISRIDVVPDEGVYRAVIIGDRAAEWRQELRFPLIQLEIARRYARPIPSIRVGFQEMDGSNLVVARYTAQQIGEAVREAAAVSRKVHLEVLRQHQT